MKNKRIEQKAKSRQRAYRLVEWSPVMREQIPGDDMRAEHMENSDVEDAKAVIL